ITSTAPSPSIPDQPTSSTARFGLAAVISEPRPYTPNPSPNARSRPRMSPSFAPTSMNAAITSVYIVIALCTPVTVVFRSTTICEMETFITLESSTMMNWADARMLNGSHLRTRPTLREPSETMTTLANRPNTALVVVDVQNAALERAHERDAVVANVGSLVERARREGVPVVWVQHSDEQLARGSDGWQLVSELGPGDAEPLVEKSYGDSFEETSLETVLSRLGVGRLVVVGAQTDWCVRSTLHGALARGYDATLVSDAHTTEDQTEWGAPPPEEVGAHTNLYWTYQSAPGRTAGTVETNEVSFT